MGLSEARPMNPVPTSVRLLDRLELARPDASDWDLLQGIFLPRSEGT